jgi:hypothetical protein
MSVFSNPAGRAGDAASRYVRALLDLLGDQDPVDVQRQLDTEVRRLVAGLDQRQLSTPEAPGKWSIAHVIDHLADQEMVNGCRIRSIVAEDKPELRGYDQDRWAAHLRWGTTPVEDVLAELAVLRRRNLRLLTALSDTEWERVGMHSERGPESARLTCQLTAGHDLVHRRQIARIRAVVTGSR